VIKGLSREATDILQVRQRIEAIKHDPSRLCVKYLYLIDGRISEGISRRAPSDIQTTPRGPKMRDLEMQEDDHGGEVALFSVSTAKRGGILRICAIPLDPSFEPWGKRVVQYFEKFAPEEHVFPMTRQKVWRHAREFWENLVYPIEDYDKIIVDEAGNVIYQENGKAMKQRISRHMRPFNLHAVRHIRATDLVVYYGFNGPNLAAFGGWTLSTAMGVSSSINRYVQLDWRSYYPKLLKKRF